MISGHRIEEIYRAAKPFLDDNRDFDEYFEELKTSYSEDELENGYTIISDKKGHGATRIKALPDLGRCNSDREAMECAKKDGIKIIEDLVFVKHHRAFYVDTPENRAILAMLVQNNPAAKIVISDDGRKTVEIQSIKFSGKRKIDWEGVEQYLKQYIGKYYTIDETDDIVYIGSDFPDEYANSKDTIKSLGTIGKAKANATQAIPELIHSLTEIKHFENFDKKHEIDAPNGWYRGTVHFTLPVTNDKGEVIGKNLFRGRMVIRCTMGNKLYLYDIVTIKKET